MEVFRKAKQDQLQSVCRGKKLPQTVQRTVVMAALAGRKDHPTADQIYDEVKPQLPGVSRTTIYRVLETFVAYGLAQKIVSSAAKARFDANAVRHHHLECLSCGAIMDLPDHRLYDIPLPQSAEGFAEVLDYAIQFRGVCVPCRNEELQHKKANLQATVTAGN